MFGHSSQPLYPQDRTADLIRIMEFFMASIDNVCVCVPHHHVSVAKLTEPAEELVVK